MVMVGGSLISDVSVIALNGTSFSYGKHETWPNNNTELTGWRS